MPQDILKKECVDASGLMIQVFNTVDAALLESSTDIKVVYYSRRRKPELEQELGVEWSGDLETLLGQSDFVSLHVRLTDDTRHMIGTNELGKIKETTILVNSSRAW